MYIVAHSATVQKHVCLVFFFLRNAIYRCLENLGLVLIVHSYLQILYFILPPIVCNQHNTKRAYYQLFLIYVNLKIFGEKNILFFENLFILSPLLLRYLFARVLIYQEPRGNLQSVSTYTYLHKRISKTTYPILFKQKILKIYDKVF